MHVRKSVVKMHMLNYVEDKDVTSRIPMPKAKLEEK